MRATLPHSAFAHGTTVQLAADSAPVHSNDAARRNIPAEGALRGPQAGLGRHKLPGVAVREPERRVLARIIGNKRQPALSDHVISVLVRHR